MQKSDGRTWILGLDLGVASIGWALLQIDQNTSEPQAIEAVGVRLFDAGVTGNVEQGRDSSKNAERRQKRQLRRQTDRRRRRLLRVFRTLQEFGLMPPGAFGDPAARHAFLLALDRRLLATCQPVLDRVGANTFPYRLRARALDEALTLEAVGRALYHLAQRRGFLSNRKRPMRKNEDEGQVKEGITELELAMRESGARTLGEYFSRLDPEDKRIRRRWTGRGMYEAEFEAIWEAQARHHPSMTPAAKAKVHEAVFWQRPLKSQRFLVGTCSLEDGVRRAPISCFEFQEFRVLQQVNHLQIEFGSGLLGRGLTKQERVDLVEALMRRGDITCAAARKILNLPRGAKFSIEFEDGKKLVGNRTVAVLREVFGDRWNQLSDSQRIEVWTDVQSIQDPAILRSRGEQHWGLSPDAADKFSVLEFESGYASLSRKAINKLLPDLENGVPYATARKTHYPLSFKSTKPVERLPPVDADLGDLRNPMVMRTLSELRKVVNAIVSCYGRPQLIHIELARDLKRSRKDRESLHRASEQRRKERERAEEQLKRNLHMAKPSSKDIERYLLWEECGEICPYSGKVISLNDLFGPTSQFDVEHIIPFARSQDDSFSNKTLCDAETNRNRKGKRTPFEAFGSNPPEWDVILSHVRAFRGKHAKAKLARFLMEEVPSDYVSRDLNDTRHASRVAADYLGRLYGGRVDADGTLRVQVSGGQVTAHLRRELSMNELLSGTSCKTRQDHRHHAVDAVAIALTDFQTVQVLARAAEDAPRHGRKRFAPVAPPWPAFLDDLRAKVETINVSTRPERRVRGALHNDTLYSQPIPSGLNGETEHHIRKPLSALKSADVALIVDLKVRQAVQAALDARPGVSPEKLFVDRANLPTLPGGSRRMVPISRVRLRDNVRPSAIGKGVFKRHVKTDANHHMAVIARIDGRGKEVRWDGEMVSMLEAMRRISAGETVVQRDWGPGRRFRFSLRGGDYLVIPEGKSQKLYRVLSVSAGKIAVIEPHDARTRKDRREQKDEITLSPGGIFRDGGRKVLVTPLGEIVDSNE